MAGPSAYIERMAAQQAAAEAARKAAAKAKAEAIAGYIGEAYGGKKYKPPQNALEMIGIQDAVLFWATESGVDNSTDDAGNSGLHKTVFDTTTYADSAQIKLLNDSGATQYLRAMAIKAKPVWRQSGENGFAHDSFVDYQSIFHSGERVFEFGNNYIVTKAQLEQLADYYAKALGALQGNAASPKNKHIYVLSIPGRGWHYEPGEWVTVQMGGAGEKEYIDSVCEIYSVSVEAGAGDLGTTILTLREVEQNWVKDSNAVARFLATGDPKWKPNNFGRVVVAARDYLGVADYYCDGTGDQTEIQAAIDYLSGTFSGGAVQLTEGTYNISAAIEMKSGILLCGSGAQTIVEKNCDDYGLEIVGTSGTAKNNVTIQDIQFKTNSADTNTKWQIYLDYASDIKIEKCYFTDSYSIAIYVNSTCTNSITIAGNTFTNCGLSHDANGVVVVLYRCSVLNNIFFANKNLGAMVDCPVAGGDGSLIQGNKIYDNWGRGIAPNNNVDISNNYISNNAQYNNSTYALAGIDIWSTEWKRNNVKNNYAVDNGNIIGWSLCESTAAPFIIGDAKSLSNCTIARSTAQKYDGSYSQKITKTATDTAEYRLCDNVNKNDLHTMVANRAYALSAYTYIMATGSPQTSEVSLILGYTTSSGGAWNETTATPSTGKDAWYVCQTANVTIPAGAKAAKALIRIAAPSSTGEAIYIDNVRLKPIGIYNSHYQNYHDTGENTYALGNSWQSPAATT